MKTNFVEEKPAHNWRLDELPLPFAPHGAWQPARHCEPRSNRVIARHEAI
ncbi:MAG: hypothetical protein FWH23_04710 [Bacteroidales bacterium]|nr:hypothetical protein [Bacteroidales bacterium]MCL2133445.1 hypothetical protein [Bacteroidales bacterium]